MGGEKPQGGPKVPAPWPGAVAEKLGLKTVLKNLPQTSSQYHCFIPKIC